MMARPELKIVTARKTTDVRSPEDMLGFLFAREAALLEDLVALRRDLAEQRVRYSEKHQLRVYAGVDTLRRLFGPEVGK